MSTYQVSTTAALEAAVQTADPGDTILLAPGVYDNVAIDGANGAPGPASTSPAGVTIESAVSARPAVLTSLDLESSRGLSFSNLVFSLAGESQPTPFYVDNSQDISFNQVNVHGTLGGDPQTDTSAMMIRYSDKVSVTNSTFQYAYFGIAHLDDDGLTITGNTFKDIRTDGIHGGGSSNVIIENNTFTDFYPVGTPADGGDHPDAIQFWNPTSTSSGDDITIIGNTMIRGAGDPIHGVLIQDVGGVPFTHVIISQNTMIGEGYDGIQIEGVDSLSITGNLVQGFADRASLVRLIQVDNGHVSQNEANGFDFDPTDSGVSQSDNQTVGPAIPGASMPSLVSLFGTSTADPTLAGYGGQPGGSAHNPYEALLQGGQGAASAYGADASLALLGLHYSDMSGLLY